MIEKMSIVDIDFFNIVNELIETNDIEGFKQLLKHNIYNPNEEKNWAIRYASTLNRHNIVELLLSDERVDPSDDQDNALKKAMFNNHVESTKALLKDERVDPSSQGCYFLINAHENKYTAMTLLLFRHEKVKKELKKNHIELFDILTKFDIKNKAITF
jgi:hypothetical protein